MPRPSSSAVHEPLAKSTVASILVALASSEFLSSSSTTPVSETMAVDDLICATTSAGSGRMHRPAAEVLMFVPRRVCVMMQVEIRVLQLGYQQHQRRGWACWLLGSRRREGASIQIDSLYVGGAMERGHEKFY